jgi:acyl-CoA synthetase (AMP-forming)/AMP-acid ligase II
VGSAVRRARLDPTRSSNANPPPSRSRTPPGPATSKIPRYWELVDQFPMTITGKVQKFVMREMAAAELPGV